MCETTTTDSTAGVVSQSMELTLGGMKVGGCRCGLYLQETIYTIVLHEELKEKRLWHSVGGAGQLMSAEESCA